MSQAKTCSSCGATLESSDESCPRCLLELGRPKDAGDTQSDGPSLTGHGRRRPARSLEEIARRFPELELISLLGEGGMGAVYQARQKRIGRLVALKVLGFDPLDQPTFAERFRREAVALARLDHPNVVKLYDFGERDGLFYLVLEFVDGTNLRTLMKQALLAPAQALAIVPQMCEALQFAHDEGIVHRDIKPENVLIDAKGRVKIADFGLAKLVDSDVHDVSLTEVGQVMGTPHYMAPEQLRGSRDVDHRADIYSLGVVFYEMLTGELPRGNFELPSKRIHVDVRLDEIVLKSLERTPERRYQHAVEVKTDVEIVSSTPGASQLESLLDSIPEQVERAIETDVGAARAKAAKGYELVFVYPNRPWHYLTIFLFLIPLAALGFNGGLWWFLGALALLAAAFWSLLQREIQGQPGLAALLKDEARDVIFARHLTALLLLGLGFGALAFGEFAIFDELAPGVRSSPSDPQSMYALETELLPALETRMPLTCMVDRSRLEFTPEYISHLDREAFLHRPWLLLLSLALCLAAASVLGSRWTDLASWRGWRMPARTNGALFGSLLLLHGVTALIASVGGSAGPLVDVLDQHGVSAAGPGSARTTDELVRNLRIALIERGYAVNAEGRWIFDPNDSARSEPQQRLHVLFADPRSPFDRWRWTWSGPRRVKPHAVFALRGLREGGFVVRGASDAGFVGFECDLGDARPRSAEFSSWGSWFQGLAAGIP